MERTLYLNEKGGLVVKKDGPSLWITERHSAGRRVPLRRIGQVIIRGNVRLDAGVITALAENGVPVTFMSRNGESIITALAHNISFTVLKAKVERLRRSEKGATKVIDLFSSRKRNIERAFLKERFPDISRAIDERGIREKDYRCHMDRMLSEKAERGAVKAVLKVLDGLFYELALKRIVEAGLDPHAGFIHRDKDFAFVKDICYAVEAARDRQLAGFFAGPLSDRRIFREGCEWVVCAESMRNIVVRFENLKKRSLGIMDDLINDFFGILREPWL